MTNAWLIAELARRLVNTDGTYTLKDGIILGRLTERLSVSEPLDVTLYRHSLILIRNGVPADKKIATIKLVREVCNLGLKEAKDTVDAVSGWMYDADGRGYADPDRALDSVLLRWMSSEDAQEWARRFEAIGVLCRVTTTGDSAPASSLPALRPDWRSSKT